MVGKRTVENLKRFDEFLLLKITVIYQLKLENVSLLTQKLSIYQAHVCLRQNFKTKFLHRNFNGNNVLTSTELMYCSYVLFQIG
jgi:hypothetical protein